MNALTLFLYQSNYIVADKSLARPGRKQANYPVRIAWISFGAFSCKGGGALWQLASRCCWNRARPWHASELLSFWVGLRTYQQPLVWFWLSLHLRLPSTFYVNVLETTSITHSPTINLCYIPYASIKITGAWNNLKTKFVSQISLLYRAILNIILNSQLIAQCFIIKIH